MNPQLNYAFTAIEIDSLYLLMGNRTEIFHLNIRLVVDSRIREIKTINIALRDDVLDNLQPALLDCRLDESGFTRHILTTAHRGLNHAMAIRTFGHMHGFTVIRGYVVMLQFFTAGSTGHTAYTHSANFTHIR